ncbi:MAG: hypothetical protein QM710_05100 [Flavobacterium sp.]
MNKWKVFAILLAIVTFGAIQETLRIITSDDADIAPQRTYLIIMGIVFTMVLAFFTIKLWKKGTR